MSASYFTRRQKESYSKHRDDVHKPLETVGEKNVVIGTNFRDDHVNIVLLEIYVCETMTRPATPLGEEYKISIHLRNMEDVWPPAGRFYLLGLGSIVVY